MKFVNRIKILLDSVRLNDERVLHHYVYSVTQRFQAVFGNVATIYKDHTMVSLSESK